jgi:hypothetical protein
VLSFDPVEHGRVFDGWRILNPAGEGLVRIARSNIQKRVSGFTGEHLGDHALNGQVFANVAGREIGWNNSRGLSVRDCRDRF